jgi:hypothetical protein
MRTARTPRRATHDVSQLQSRQLWRPTHPCGTTQFTPSVKDAHVLSPPFRALPPLPAHLGVERLDAAVEDFGAARLLRDVRHGEASVAERLGRTPRREERHAVLLDERARERHEAALVRDGQERDLCGDEVRVRARDGRDYVRHSYRHTRKGDGIRKAGEYAREHARSAEKVRASDSAARVTKRRTALNRVREFFTRKSCFSIVPASGRVSVLFNTH